YYYPKATDLIGEVVPRQSRIGIMAFDTFRLSTPSIQIHFSDVRLGNQKVTFNYAIRSPGLAQDIQVALAEPRLVDRVAMEVQRIAANQAAMVRQSATGAIRKSGSGCGCIMALAIMTLPTAALAWALIAP